MITLLNAESAVFNWLMVYIFSGSTGPVAPMLEVTLTSTSVTVDPSSINANVLTVPFDPFIQTGRIFRQDYFFTVHVKLMTYFFESFSVFSVFSA